jgi:hypothetical protein
MGYFDDVRAAFHRGETALVERLSHQELARARASADTPAEVEALCMLARAALRRDDLPEAGRLAVQARTVARTAGESRLEQGPLHILAGCARLAGDAGAARVLMGESIALNESLGESRMVAVEQSNLAYVELHSGNADGARELFTAARQHTFQNGVEGMVPVVTLGAAVMAAADGEHRRAALLLGSADGAYRAREEIPDPDEAIELAALRDRLVPALGQEAFDAAYEAGASLDPRQALGG